MRDIHHCALVCFRPTMEVDIDLHDCKENKERPTYQTQGTETLFP